MDLFNKPVSRLILPLSVTRKKRVVFGCLDYKNVMVFKHLRLLINDPLLHRCD